MIRAMSREVRKERRKLQEGKLILTAIFLILKLILTAIFGSSIFGTKLILTASSVAAAHERSSGHYVSTVLLLILNQWCKINPDSHFVDPRSKC